MRRPRIRADYQPVVLDVRRLVLVGEGRSLMVDDSAGAALAALLDGTRSPAELVAALDGRHTMVAVLTALRRLDALGVLTEGPVAAPADQAAGWDALGVDPDAVATNVLVVEAGATLPITAATGQMAAVGPGAAVRFVDVGDPALPRHLRGVAGPDGAGAPDGPSAPGGAGAPDGPGAPVGSGGPRDPGRPGAPVDPGGPVVVVAAASVLDPRLARVNSLGIAWLLVRPRGNVVTLGPHFAPGETGCWECLRQRWSENEQLETYLEQAHGTRISAARAALPGTLALVSGLVANELPVLARHGRSPRLTGRMLALDTRDHTMSQHVLVRQPQCPACGDPDLVRKRDPVITLAAAPAGRDARTIPLEDTYERLEHHVSPYLGVVSKLAPLDGYSNGVTFSYGAGHNFALPRDPGALRKNLRGQSGGKGRTELAAKVGALGEAIERYSGVWRDDRPVHRASYAQLGPDRATPLRDLLLFSEDQYTDRDRRNADEGAFHWIPRPVDDAVELDWTAAWSLTHERTRDLPAAYCWYGHPEARGLDACAGDSNGSAAGNTLAEAIVQGFGEVVERDAVALWWYHRSLVPAVDLDSFGDRWIDDLRTFHATVLGRELWALDLTSDLGVPTFAGVSRRTSGPTEDVIVGFGAHLDPATALNRALAEVNQFLPAVARRNADGTTRYGLTDRASVRWFTEVRVEEQPWLRGTTETTTAQTYGSQSTGDLATDVEACVAAAAKVGLEVLVVDQSRPDLELAVAKVVVPGARHFWRRLGRGRLWDVPARLGRGPVATTEAGLNPYSVFF